MFKIYPIHVIGHPKFLSDTILNQNCLSDIICFSLWKSFYYLPKKKRFISLLNKMSIKGNMEQG